jgi:hypothetical protein
MLSPLIATESAVSHPCRAQAYRLVTLAADGRVLVWIWHKLEMPLYGWVGATKLGAHPTQWQRGTLCGKRQRIRDA